MPHCAQRDRGGTPWQAAAGMSHQIGEHFEDGTFRFPLLLTHEEMASMTCTTRETVTRTLGQFRKEGWIPIEDSLVTVHMPERLQSLI
jgi:CRP-like cAMP-binding protein